MNDCSGHVADLRNEAAMLQRLVHRLIGQLAERDAQIRMVLEERFYRPQTTPAEQRPAVKDAEEFNDVTQFDAGSDEDWLKREAALLAKIEEVYRDGR